MYDPRAMYKTIMESASKRKPLSSIDRISESITEDPDILFDEDFDVCPSCGSKFAMVSDGQVSCSNKSCANYDEEYAKAAFGMSSASTEPQGVIIVHVHGDGEFVDATSQHIDILQDFLNIRLPNGDIIYVARSVDALLDNINIDPRDRIAEALAQEGFLEYDDEGDPILRR